MQVPDKLLIHPRVAEVTDAEDRPLAALVLLLAPSVLLFEAASLGASAWQEAIGGPLPLLV